MKVKELRRRLESMLDTLEGYDDDREVKMVSNTYFLGGACRTFIGISGYDGGYINCNDMVEEDEDESEDEE